MLSSSEAFQTDVTIWTAGIRGTDLNTTPDLKRTRSGRIIVNKFSQVLQFGDKILDNTFAIGDICAFPLDNQGKMSPQLAQFAVRQARNVAKNILRETLGEKMIEFEYTQKGQIISLGRDCIGTLNGFLISGWLSESTEEFTVDNYIKAVLNRGEGLENQVYDRNSLRTGIATSINFISYLCKRLLMIPRAL
jgi:NADH dehydrogenase FAD-containing subunit